MKMNEKTGTIATIARAMELLLDPPKISECYDPPKISKWSPAALKNEDFWLKNLPKSSKFLSASQVNRRNMSRRIEEISWNFGGFWVIYLDLLYFKEMSVIK